MNVVNLNSSDAVDLAAALLQGATQVAYDPIDQALKVKAGGRWSPPIGRLDADRSTAHDLAEESRTLRDTARGEHPIDCHRRCCATAEDYR